MAFPTRTVLNAFLDREENHRVLAAVTGSITEASFPCGPQGRTEANEIVAGAKCALLVRRRFAKRSRGSRTPTCEGTRPLRSPKSALSAASRRQFSSSHMHLDNTNCLFFSGVTGPGVHAGSGSRSNVFGNSISPANSDEFFDRRTVRASPRRQKLKA